MSDAGDSPPLSQTARPTSLMELNLKNAYGIHLNEVEFSVTSSSKGGFDIKIGSYIIHVGKPLSAHHPLGRMLIFARQLHGDKFGCLDFFLPKKIVGQISANGQSEAPNDETSEAGYCCGMGEAGNFPVQYYESALTDEMICKTGTEETTVNIFYNVRDIYRKPRCTMKLVADGGLPAYSITVSSCLHEQITLKRTDYSNGTLSPTSSAEHKVVSELVSQVVSELVSLKKKVVSELAPGNHRGPVLLAARDGRIIVLVWDIHMLGWSNITGAHVANPANRARVFIVDSGAAVHATHDIAAFVDEEVNMEQNGRAVRVANGHSLEVRGHGSVNFGAFTVSNVKYIPGLTRNVLSVSQLFKQEYMTEFLPDGCFIRDARSQVVAYGRLVNGLYELDHPPVAQVPA